MEKSDEHHLNQVITVNITKYGTNQHHMPPDNDALRRTHYHFQGTPTQKNAYRIGSFGNRQTRIMGYSTKQAASIQNRQCHESQSKIEELLQSKGN